MSGLRAGRQAKLLALQYPFSVRHAPSPLHAVGGPGVSIKPVGSLLQDSTARGCISNLPFCGPGDRCASPPPPESPPPHSGRAAPHSPPPRK
ncbi:putative DNA repair protein, partial [Naja naja]